VPPSPSGPLFIMTSSRTHSPGHQPVIIIIGDSAPAFYAVGVFQSLGFRPFVLSDRSSVADTIKEQSPDALFLPQRLIGAEETDRIIAMVREHDRESNIHTIIVVLVENDAAGMNLSKRQNWADIVEIGAVDKDKLRKGILQFY